jgi:monothiol glutaredoxin
MNEDFRQKMDNLIENNKVVLFMKGNRQQPMCGFSARVVGMLDELGMDYETVCVITDPEVRSGMKEYSSWPTFPQLYVDKEFVGGCDIVTGMFSSGELHGLVGVEREEVAPPSIELSEAAADALRAAMARSEGSSIHIDVSPRFEYDIWMGPKEPGELETESAGISICVRSSSAKRAEGMKLGYESGMGFTIDNPNEPPSVKQLPVKQLKQWLDEGRPVVLYDVRGSDERAIASISDALPFDESAAETISDMPKEAVLVFHCHHGMRSMGVAQRFLAAGHTQVFNLNGGIDAWSSEIDPAVPTY